MDADPPAQGVKIACRCGSFLHADKQGKVKVALARELAGFVWAMMTFPETLDPKAT